MTDTIRAVVPMGESRFYLKDPPAEVDELLHAELSYFKDGAEHTPQFKSGGWDGRVRLYKKGQHQAPVGLLDRTRTILADHGYELRVTIEGERGGEPVRFGWDFPHDLRGYQREAVAAVLDHGGGVVSIPTGAGKTVVALRVIHAIGQRALVFVHTLELLHQWADRIRRVLDVEPGVIGSGKWSEGPVTVAMLQTLMADREGGGQRVEDLSDSYGLAVWDECHRTSAADAMHAVGLGVDVPWRIGLSATPWRRVDGAELKIEGAIGGVAARVTAAELIEAGYLARPTFRYIEPAEYGELPLARDGEEWPDVYRRCVELHPGRNAAVAHAAADLTREGYTVLVSVDRLSQGLILTSALSGLSPEDALAIAEDRAEDGPGRQAFLRAAERAHVADRGAVFLSGDDPTERRQDVLDGFGKGEPPILVSTLLREGADLPELNAVVLAGGGKSDVDKIQRAGRALRPAGGDHAVIADVRDRGKYLGEHFQERQEGFARYYGEYGPEGWHGPRVEAVREWLSGRDIPLDALLVYSEPTTGRVVIEPGEYLGDRWDDYVAVMRSTDAIGYDPDRQVNYVKDSDRLPEAVGAEVGAGG